MDLFYFHEDQEQENFLPVYEIQTLFKNDFFSYLKRSFQRRNFFKAQLFERLKMLNKKMSKI